jgi:hypothetical protein
MIGRNRKRNYHIGGESPYRDSIGCRDCIAGGVYYLLSFSRALVIYFDLLHVYHHQKVLASPFKKPFALQRMGQIDAKERDEDWHLIYQGFDPKQVRYLFLS